MDAPRTLERRRKALAKLAHAGAVLAPDRDGHGHAVYPHGDRRRRPTARLKAEDVHVLAADGALAPSGISGCWLLSGAGRDRLRRDAAEDAPFAEQHSRRITRTVMEGDGKAREVRAVEGPVLRLSRIADSAGVAFFQGREIAAARELWTDHERGQRGLFRGSDWSAPPLGSVARGAGGGQEHATVEAMAARQRVDQALGHLPAALAATLKAFLLEETGLEALEHQRRWPSRSAKLVLKIALDMLADHYGLA